MMRIVRPVIQAAALFLATTSGFAAPPTISGISPRGFAAGETRVVVQGAQFTPETTLLVDLPNAVVTIDPAVVPNANAITYVVKLPAETPPAVFAARVRNADGVSPQVLCTVDAFPSVAEIEPNEKPSQAQELTLPVAVEGRLGGVELDVFQFAGTAGQRIVAEIAGRRLGADLRPSLRLSLNGRELVCGREERLLGGDARFVATLPETGTYHVELHDVSYRADGGQYRLYLGDFDFARPLFPLGGTRGTTVELTTEIGSFPFAIPTTPGQEIVPVPLPAGGLRTPFPSWLAVSDLPEVLEAPTVEAPQMLSVPGIVNGRLAAPSEQDRYRVAVTPGQKLRVWIEAERLGGPLDSIVEVQDAAGAVLMQADDGLLTADPDLVYLVPEGRTELFVAINDVQRRGGPAYSYRLGLQPVPGGDFTLELLTTFVNVPAGGSGSIRVRAVRRDFNEPIRLQVRGTFPAGWTAPAGVISPGATEAFLSFSAPADQPLTVKEMQIVGEAGPPEAPTISRVAQRSVPRLEARARPQSLPWLAPTCLLANGAPGLLTLEVVPAQPMLLRMHEATATIRAHRAAGQTGPINITVLTSQDPQKQVGIQPQALQIPAGMNEGVLKLTIPSNATELGMTYVVTGQLLDPTNNQPLATVEAPAVVTEVAHPFQVRLIDPPASLQPGTRTVLRGEVLRRAPFKDPVQVQLLGIPGNFRTLTTLAIPPEQSQFEWPILVPFNQPASALPLQLTGLWVSANLPQTPVPYPFTISAEPAPAALEIFSDGQDFLEAMNEGPGMATLDIDVKHAGRESLRVTGDLKGRANMLGLNVAIVEKPSQPGEYRYLRYAWKKKDGQGIQLRLAHNGQFGATSERQTQFYYTAGVAAQPGAISVADAQPNEWVVVTLDLFADHGNCRLTGLSLAPLAGGDAWLDHVWLGRTEADLP